MSLSLKQERHQRKIARIEARLNPEQKRRIEYAARLKGTSLSDFMVLSADDAVARAIQEHEVWTLAGRDRELFVQALLNPPAPSARIRLRRDATKDGWALCEQEPRRNSLPNRVAQR